MQSNRSIQIVLILLTSGLIAFLFFNGRNNPTALVNSGKSSEGIGMKAPAGTFNFELLEQDSEAKLSKEGAAKLKKLKPKQDAKSLAEIAALYEKERQPALAGYYYKQLAEKEPKNSDWWFKMGTNFFNAQQMVDSSTYMYFVQLSTMALDKTLELDPSNLEAMTDQAINYKEGMGDVMKGVGLLRKVTQIDSNYRKAIFYLGLLSIESGQMDKAENRFQKLTSLPIENNDPNYPLYFRYLGQVEMALNKKDKALIAFRQYQNYVNLLSTDPKLKKDAAELVSSAQ
jgi:tetratricopeptide (TPR) repeat protein